MAVCPNQKCGARIATPAARNVEPFAPDFYSKPVRVTLIMCPKCRTVLGAIPR